MSASLIIQLKKERDDAHREAFNFKVCLNNILNNENPETRKPFKTKKEILEYIRKVISL